MAVRIGKQARYPKSNFSSATELQTLLDSGQKLIILGEGTYSIDSPLTVPAGVTLSGDGLNVTKIKWSSPLNTTSMIRLQAGARVENLTIEQGTSGVAVNAVQTLGSDCYVWDCLITDLRVLFSQSLCRIRGCKISGNAAGILITGENCFVENNIFSGNLKAVHVSGANAALIQNNKVVGSVISTHGVHLDGAVDYCLVLDNQISAVGANGIGIYMDVSGTSNQLKGNVFWGAFGVSGHAIRVSALTPSTNQLIANHTLGATPASVRLQPADLSSAVGIANT